jgi:perosamine synthetase
MIPSLVKKISLKLPARINKIIKMIDINALGTVFIIDNNQKLIGSITDGDLRRYFLKNKKYPNIVEYNSKIVNKKPFSLPITSDIQIILKRFKSNNTELIKPIKCFPLVDSKKKIVDIATNEKPRNFPIAEPDIGLMEYKNVIEAFNSGWISSKGPFIEIFESKFSKYLNGGYSVSTTSGTTALQLGMSALGISKNDEVIIPSFTFAGSINSIINCGAIPVVCDVEMDTWTLSLKSVKKLITKKTKAIMIVHIYGQPCQIDEIKKFCKTRNIFLIEDCAEALGAIYKKRLVGLDGDCSCFSFFANKTITTGEGGMVVFQNKKIAQKAAILRNHGMSMTKNYWHDHVGYNYRMTNIQAAIGSAQIDRIDHLISMRKKIFENYNKLLHNEKNITFLPKKKWSKNSYWLYTIIIKKGDREKLINKLQLKGIDVRRTFYPLNIMPPYKKYSKFRCQISEYLGLKGISLPTSNVTLKEQKYIIKILKEEIKKL